MEAKKLWRSFGLTVLFAVVLWVVNAGLLSWYKTRYNNFDFMKFN